MLNGSLDNHLFSESKDKTTTLECERRYKIMLRVALMLHYLHNDCNQKVVHYGLKASNILLDSNFNAQLGDFILERA